MEAPRSAPGPEPAPGTVASQAPGASAGTRPTKRPRWPRWLLGCFAFLALLVFLAPLALGLAPARHAVEDAIADELDRPVAIGSLSGWWWGGIEMKDFVVRDRAEMGGEPFLTVERIH